MFGRFIFHGAYFGALCGAMMGAAYAILVASYSPSQSLPEDVHALSAALFAGCAGFGLGFVCGVFNGIMLAAVMAVTAEDVGSPAYAVAMAIISVLTTIVFCAFLDLPIFDMWADSALVDYFPLAAIFVTAIIGSQLALRMKRNHTASQPAESDPA